MSYFWISVCRFGLCHLKKHVLHAAPQRMSEIREVKSLLLMCYPKTLLYTVRQDWRENFLTGSGSSYGWSHQWLFRSLRVFLWNCKSMTFRQSVVHLFFLYRFILKAFPFGCSVMSIKRMNITELLPWMGSQWAAEVLWAELHNFMITHCVCLMWNIRPVIHFFLGQNKSSNKNTHKSSSDSDDRRFAHREHLIKAKVWIQRCWRVVPVCRFPVTGVVLVLWGVPVSYC